ncbi:hyaluronan metabolic process [Homalodisca vitripennis]|nr:hyaluronan metabolic process [Homalodisca vitripennis]
MNCHRTNTGNASVTELVTEKADKPLKRSDLDRWLLASSAPHAAETGTTFRMALVDEGYFVHFFAPEDLPQLKKHIVFVLDYSGSMGGRKLEQLKEAMDKILSDLSPKDHFSIVVFQSYVEVWSPTAMYSSATEHLSRWDIEAKPEIIRNTTLDKRFVIEATPENIASARAYLGNYSDLGATNIMGGLRTGLELVSIGSDLWSNESDPPQPVVVFLTDGEPNVEEYNTDAIINKTKPLNTKDCPIFSLAFGYGADFNFLRKLSLSNYGFARNIYEAADATDQLKNFYKTISSPLLSNVTFTYLPGQVDNSSRTKIDFPVFFNGSELVVAGKINNNEIKEKETIGELSGLTANGFHRYPIIIDFIPIIVKPKNRTFGHLEKTWAYLTIQQLLDKADSLDKTEERNQTKEKALNLALQFVYLNAYVTDTAKYKIIESEKVSALWCNGSTFTRQVRDPGSTPGGASSCGGDTSQQWRIVNRLTGAIGNTKFDKVVLEDGSVVEDPLLIANEINSYLANVSSVADNIIVNDPALNGFGFDVPVKYHEETCTTFITCKCIELEEYSFVTPLTSLVVVKPNETESAVDTTQVKPGSNDMLGYAPVGVAAFGASPGGFGGSAGGLSSSSGSSAFSPQYSLAYTPMPACEFHLQFKIFAMFCKWKVTFYEAYPEIKCIEALTAGRIFFDMLVILPCNLIPPLCNETGSSGESYADTARRLRGTLGRNEAPNESTVRSCAVLYCISNTSLNTPLI